MTSLFNNQFDKSQKKLIETFSSHQTKTLKKNEKKNPEHILNFNTKTKNGLKKNEEKKQIISIFELKNESFKNQEKNDNKFSNIDLIKDSNCFGTQSFIHKLNSMGFEKMEHLKDSFTNLKQNSSSLKKIKKSFKNDPIRIESLNNFFGELTPDLLTSRIIPGEENFNGSIKDNESLMIFRNKKQNINNSIMLNKNFPNIVLSPDKTFEKRRLNRFQQENFISFESQNHSIHPEVLTLKNNSNYYMIQPEDKANDLNLIKLSPNEFNWSKNISSPQKRFQSKGIKIIFFN